MGLKNISGPNSSNIGKLDVGTDTPCQAQVGDHNRLMETIAVIEGNLTTFRLSPTRMAVTPTLSLL